VGFFKSSWLLMWVNTFSCFSLSKPPNTNISTNYLKPTFGVEPEVLLVFSTKLLRLSTFESWKYLQQNQRVKLLDCVGHMPQYIGVNVKETFKDWKAFATLTPKEKGWSFLSQLNKRSHYWRIVGNETSIKVGKSKKTLNIMNRSWNNPINNGLNFTSIHVNEDPCEYMSSP